MDVLLGWILLLWIFGALGFFAAISALGVGFVLYHLVRWIFRLPSVRVRR